MSIEKLCLCATPPESPVHTGIVYPWAEVERNLGTALPNDYKQLIETYGEGDFYSLLQIFSPFAKRSDLLSWNENRRSLHEDMQDIFCVFPEEGGILCVGGDEYSNRLFWLTKGHPDDWPIVFSTREMLLFSIYCMSLTQFLENWLAGRLHPEIIANLNIQEQFQPIFTPVP